MNLKQFLLYLSEEARNKADISNHLVSSSEQIMKHIFKIYFYKKQSPSTIDHWKREIYSFVNRTYKIKGSNKFPKKKQILYDLWDHTKDMFSQFYDMTISNLNFNYKNLGTIMPNKEDENNLYNICNNYFDWLSEKLSKNGVITEQEVFDKLDALLEL